MLWPWYNTQNPNLFTMRKKTAYIHKYGKTVGVKIIWNETHEVEGANGRARIFADRKDAAVVAKELFDAHPGIYNMQLTSYNSKGEILREDIIGERDTLPDNYHFFNEAPRQDLRHQMEGDRSFDWRQCRSGLGGIYNRLDASEPLSPQEAKDLLRFLQAHQYHDDTKGVACVWGNYFWDFSKALKRFVMVWKSRDGKGTHLAEIRAYNAKSIWQYYEDSNLLEVHEIPVKVSQ